MCLLTYLMLAADRGLQRDSETMSMIPTYVTSIPNGTEQVRPLILYPRFQQLFSSLFPAGNLWD